MCLYIFLYINKTNWIQQKMNYLFEKTNKQTNKNNDDDKNLKWNTTWKIIFTYGRAVSLSWSPLSPPSLPHPHPILTSFLSSSTFVGWRRDLQDPNSGYQRSAQGIGAHVHDAFEVGQAADQTGHPQHGRWGHHATRAASAREESEPESGLLEAARRRESGWRKRSGQQDGASAPGCPTSYDSIRIYAAVFSKLTPLFSARVMAPPPTRLAFYTRTQSAPDSESKRRLSALVRFRPEFGKEADRGVVKCGSMAVAKNISSGSRPPFNSKFWSSRSKAVRPPWRSVLLNSKDEPEDEDERNHEDEDEVK